MAQQLRSRLVAALDARLRGRGVGGIAIARGEPREICATWLPESLSHEPGFLVYKHGDDDRELSTYEVWLAEVERTEAVVRLLAQIQLAGEAQWQAFAWILERLRSDDYSLLRQRGFRRSEPRVTQEEFVAALASARGAASTPT